MTYRSYLSQSPSGSYYFRLRLGHATAQKLGVKEVRRSLQTNDRINARRKALELFEVVRQLSTVRQDSNAPEAWTRLARLRQPLVERKRVARLAARSGPAA